MTTPQAKRRRLDDAAKTLHKPFKSPFRTPLKPALPPSEQPSTERPGAFAETPVPTKVRLFDQTPHPDISSTPRHLPAATPIRRAPKKTSPALTREIIQLRSDVQILSQALALATSDKDVDLTSLVDTWRTASRAAAEELFASTRDRVNRMGGVGAWKEREREQKEWRMKRNLEDLEAERARREEEHPAGMDMEYGYEDGLISEAKPVVEEVGANDDDSFTMDMMLKTLNIDLDLIGYNKTAQRWDG
ncbi:hypothetical protein M011DRAFT_113384 [Sporormia fimetaria CBS 119925]|uniref:DNA repair protein Dds20/Mei5 n=1 Tax=Sporormia fimetaria CBS 119925 TaxID=1340428 RepID=A0A6A6VP99_9PLEO|nr:hypothetical protein M011DRAFT_113384 [Sporormia fimetaria CBS 119925]